MSVRRESFKPHAAAVRLRDFWRDERAATAIEYAIVAAGIGAVVAASVTLLGDTLLANYYTKIEEAVASVAPEAAPP